jgi:cytochrome c peroxidase
MLRTSSLLLSGLLCCGLAMTGCTAPAADTSSDAGATPTAPRAMQVISIWRAHLDTLALSVARLDTAALALHMPADVPQVQAAFVEARRAFKLAEVGLEYYMPSTAKEMNGPALPEVEDEEGPEAVFPPKGFQVIEEVLYGEDPIAEREALTTETATLRSLVTRAQTMMGAQQASDAHVWDAVKLELARIATLGMAGFDSPVAGHGLVEADAALEGVVRTLAPYRSDDRTWSAMDSLLADTRRMLVASSDRDAFDHFAFLAQRFVPLGHAVQHARMALAIDVPAERRAFRMDAATVFDSAAFDVLGFAPLDASTPTPAQVALGAQLFRDTRLSGDGTRACSSCHLPGKAFTDGLITNQARGGAPLARNTPTVINSGLQLGSFTDLRTTFLEDQVTDVIENVDELHGNLATIAVRLSADSLLAQQFRAAFAGEPARSDSLVTAAHIRSALAAYQRSLSRLNSPVDRALRGEVGVLSEEERLGFNVFVGKGKCATCHFLPLTNGTVPPMYQKSEVEVLGVPSRAVTANANVDPDIGRYRLTRAEPHRYAFRTPSIRNVALTAPYMHNGVYRTLEEVVEFYDRGGGAGIGIALDNQTLPADALKLTPPEKRALVAFMRALTDTTGTSGH